jgi:5-methyltetrahydrofolate--homocysteine methyltransferase
MSDLSELTAAIVAGDRGTAVRITGDAIAARDDPPAILHAMTAAMQLIGHKYQCNEIYVPEMLIAARAMKEALAVLEPILVVAGVRPIGTAVIGTVQGDLHDIGKNLVGMMWRGANIEVIDLGTNVAPERFAEAAKKHSARIVGASALLTTTMLGMREVVEAIRAANLGDTKVIVGGAPITAEFAEEVGADGFAEDAGSAADVALQALRS